MQLKLKKGNIEETILFIKSLNLAGGKVNRARFRLIKLLNNKNQEIREERLEVAKNYANLDEKGNPIIKDDGNLNINDDKIPAFAKAQNELFSENSSLTLDDYSEQIKTLYESLCNYDEKLTGKDLIVYGTLLDALENAGFTEGERKNVKN